MKKYFLSIGLALAAVVIVLNLSAFKNETKDSNYILVEIYEIPKYTYSGVHIHYGGGKMEHIPFKAFAAEHHDDNGEIIVSSLNKLVADGYVITHTAAGLANTGMITKVFMQKK